MKTFGIKLSIFFVSILFLTNVVDIDSVNAQERFKLRLGSLCAVGSPCTKGVEKIAELAKKKSKGRLSIDIFPAGQLGTAPSVIDSLKMGAADIMWDDFGFLAMVDKDYQILSVPFLFDTQEEFHKWINGDDHNKLKEKLISKHGLRLISAKANKLGRVFVSKKPIFTPDDMKGIKIRVPELAAYQKSMEALGAKPTTLPWGEIYMGMKLGTVEACEGAFDIVIPHKFHEVAPYITYTEHIRATWMFLMSEKSFAKLPNDLKKVLTESVEEGSDYYNKVIFPSIKEEFTERLLKEKGYLIFVNTKSFRDKTEIMYKEISTSMEDKGLLERAKKTLQ